MKTFQRLFQVSVRIFQVFQTPQQRITVSGPFEYEHDYQGEL